MTTETSHIRRTAGLRGFLWQIPFAVLLLGPSLPACNDTTPVVCDGGSGRGASNCLGFRFGSPSVNGIIAGDSGWDNGFLYVLDDQNSTSVQSTVQGVRETDGLYLAFEINNDSQFNENDAIVLAFDPDGSAANHRRIHIFPVTASGAQAGGVPRLVDYWKDSTNAAWQNLHNTAPSWVTDNIKVTSLVSGTANHYRVEMKIPIVAAAAGNGINLVDTGDFGFYFSVLDFFTTGGAGSGGPTNNVAEMSWPIGVNVGDFIEDTPAASVWGNGILGRVANGVSISGGDITTDQPVTNNISITGPTTFSALVRNNMVDGSGTAATANNVAATFLIANWGIPATSEWDEIPTAGNPTSEEDLTTASRNYEATWDVTTSPNLADYIANFHQCIRVSIATSGPNTLLVNRISQVNMDFVDTSSPFDGKARVGVRGYKLPQGAKMHEILLTEFNYHTDARSPWTSAITGATPLASTPTPSGSRARQYLLQLDGGSEKGVDLATRIEPPTIKIPREIVKLVPGRARAPIRVTPGNIVTVFVSGTIVPRKGDKGRLGRPVGGNGASLAASERPAGRFLLSAQHAPETQVGAVIGSMDGFKEQSFPIGRARTFQVPSGASELTLGINDTDDGLRLHSGEGFTIEVMQSAPEPQFRTTNARLSEKAGRNVTVLSLGQNLPTWILCGQRRTGGTLTVDKVPYQRFENVGCYGYIVKSIGQ